MKKLPFHVMRAPCGGPFWSNTWLPTRLIWADQIFLIILYLKCKMQNATLILQKMSLESACHLLETSCSYFFSKRGKAMI